MKEEPKKFRAVWGKYPHRLTGEPLETKTKDFDEAAEAIDFLQRVRRINSVVYCGGRVERTDTGKTVIRINKE